jgi:hypothetical protein
VPSAKKVPALTNPNLSVRQFNTVL